MKTTLGTCSICGGAVTVETVTWSVVPPTPKCESCGSVPVNQEPVIPMQKRPEPLRVRVPGVPNTGDARISWGLSFCGGAA